MLQPRTRYPLILFILLGLLLPAITPAQEEGVAAVTPVDDPQLQSTIDTLHSLIELQVALSSEIQELEQQLLAASTAAEKKDIQARLEKLEADLQTTNRNLRGIGAGADIASLRVAEETKFSLQIGRAHV